MIRSWIIRLLRLSERYVKTDMVYVAKNTFWLNLNTISTSLFAFGLSIAFAKFLPKEVYGQYQFLVSFGSAIGALTLTGMNVAVTQAVARGFDRVFLDSIRIQLRYNVLAFFLGFAIALYYFFQDDTIFGIAIVLISILLPIGNTYNTWTAFLSGRKDFKKLSIYNLIILCVYYPIMFIVSYLAPHTLVLIVVSFIATIAANLFVFLKVKKMSVGRETEKEALDYGVKLSFSNILPIVALHIDNIAIFHFLGATPLAIYAFASNIPERFGSLCKPIASVAFPKMANQDHDTLRKHLPGKIMYFLFFMIMVSLLYIFISYPIFKTFFPAYLNAVAYSRLYIIVIIFSTISSLSMNALFAIRSKHIYVFNNIQAIFSILTITTGVYFFGLVGAIYGKIISSFVFFIVSFLIHQKMNHSSDLHIDTV